MARTDAQDPTGIRFGTSGWRGVLGEAVTFPRLRALVRATAGWMRDQSSGSDRVLIGYDTRFASLAMAEIAAAVVADEGLEACLSRGPVPTPVLTHAVHRRRVAGGLMLTASHNPPEYHGIKVFGPDGATIPDRDAGNIEARLASASACGGRAGGRIRRIDLASAYRRDLLRLLGSDRRSGSPARVFYDAMHGAGAGVLDSVLARAGFRVTSLRVDADPGFGGSAPDPIAANLAQLAGRVEAGRGRRLGLATDGDADRIGVVLSDGRILSETEVLALLVDHLAGSGRIRRGLAISLATGSLVERVASAHGLPVVRRPIGFKHLAGEMLAGQVDMAGEESGGFAWSRMGVDKDGMLAGALLAELASTRRGGLSRRLEELEQRFGRSDCGRRALALTPDRQRGLDAIAASPPIRVGRSPVRAIDREDGLHLALDDGFVMWRRSGTEPVVRLYAEASGPVRLTARLAEAARLLERSAAERPR